MTTLEIVAASCAAQMQASSVPQVSRSIRREVVTYVTEHMAHAMAEDVTGCTRSESDLLSRYPRSELSANMVVRSNDYRMALASAYFDLNQLDYADLLAKCERLSGNRMEERA